MERHPGRDRSLRWRIPAVLLFAALLPLLLAGLGSWIVFGNLLERKSVELMRRSVEHHADAIEAHLAERRHLLQTVAENQGKKQVMDQLREIYDNLNQITGQGFVDLGVIDAEGNHVAYVGPYDLLSRNYRQADWFREVLVRGWYVSDVFLGFREEPHCVVAVRSSSENNIWILRATINSAQFDDQVQSGFRNGGGEAFIINHEGLLQTSARHNGILDSTSLADIPFFTGLRIDRLEDNGHTIIRVMTWINDNRWLLVVQQDSETVRAPVDQAIARGAYVVLIAVLILIFATFLATWHLIRRIERVTAERESISRAFVRSAKLASIGELTTGLAHEINNPLAIISAEQTNVADILNDPEATPADRDQALESVKRCRSQVRRCATITQKLLQFGRSRESHTESVDLAPRLHEIQSLLERQASVRGVRILTHVDTELPRVLADPVELEQIIVNLINNAFDAMPGGGKIHIRTTIVDDKVHVDVVDSGSGIPRENLDRVFEPFFTTKPVGKGTGLGLSVCYGIVRAWGAQIEIHSEPGEGTTVRLILSISQKEEPETPEAQ